MGVDTTDPLAPKGIQLLKAACIILAGVTLVPVAGTARRFEPSYSNRYKTCVKDADGVTLALKDCASAEYKIWDDQLNADYRSIMSELPAARRISFRSNERDWLKRRDADCVKQRASQDGGSLGDILYTQCVLNTTIARAHYVRLFKTRRAPDSAR